MRFIRLERFLTECIDSSGVEICVFEEVRRHLGTDAAHVYGGIVAVITGKCESRKIPYAGVPVQKIKKFATGKGNAKKDAMIQSASRLVDRKIKDDNEADAICLGLFASEGIDV